VTQVEYTCPARMRDGTVLSADVYRPSSGGPWPVLLARTPYGKRDPTVLAALDPLAAARRGFLVVIQDVRGRFDSDGVWAPMAHERDDGYDTIAWATRLPGSNGTVAMYGPSYLGHVQLAALAAGSPGLVGTVPAFTWSDPGDGLVARAGVPERGLVTQWTTTLGFEVLTRRGAGPDEFARLAEALDHLADPTDLALPTPEPSPAWAPASDLRVPTLVIAGWFDAFLQGGLDTYQGLRGVDCPTALIVGPWSHNNQSGHLGDVTYGVAAAAATLDLGPSLHDRQLDWLSGRHDSGALAFVMGVNQWRRLDHWPPPTVDTAWYLGANGLLWTEPPGPGDGYDELAIDPDAPVPTHGGNLLMSPEFPPGPLDQAPIEQRPDVLVYTSAPLVRAVSVLGAVRAHLNATPDTDWVIRLCDVEPGGVSRLMADGIVRAGRRLGEHRVDLWSTAHVFRPGHRIRVQVTWSSFPRWERHPAPPVRQRIHHGPTRPSRLVLPVSVGPP
jgi:putative CocE/NonD family hydrolase